MLRSKALSEKVLVLGIDGMDPRFTRRMVDEGKMPNTKKLIERGSARHDLMLLGAMPTITPPMWATLGTGTYPMTHGIIDYNISPIGEPDMTIGGFFSHFLKAEPIWNVSAEAGKKTLVWHWPGGSFPPTIDNPNLMMVDGSSPGAIGFVYAQSDYDTVFVASEKATEVMYKPFSVQATDWVDVEGGFPAGKSKFNKAGVSDELKARKQQHKEELKKAINVDGYEISYLDVTSDVNFPVNDEGHGGCMYGLAEFRIGCSISPITEPTGWAFDVPEGAKEFVAINEMGKLTRYCLILKNENGIYDRVAFYKNKETAEPIVILENDVFTEAIPSRIPAKDGEDNVIHNMRMLEIAEDGSYLRIWSSRAVHVDNDSVWFPKSLFKEITGKFGPMMPTSQMGGHDKDLITKCNYEQWQRAAKWQAKALNYMIEEHGVEAIFSHFHNVDMQGHDYMKFLKTRPTSRYPEEEIVKFAEATYKLTDDYIGEFLHLLDKGWSILVVSDHSLVCPEGDISSIGDNTGMNAFPFVDWGYTVLRKDADGNTLPEVDWTQTKAIQTRTNSIYINLKGRDKYGIVEPEDKYELEEKIITDLYSLRDSKTGHRIVAFALHNKDAVLLGLGGPYGADITFCVYDDYTGDHGNSMSTACGHNDTSVSPIFIAAGQGIKEGYVIDRYIREVDVAPTAAVLLGIDFPAECEGAPAYQIFTEKL